MRRAACLSVAAAGLVVAGSLGWLYVARATRVALKINLDSTAARPRSRCLLNPFRDRLPERAAAAYLDRMRQEGPAPIVQLVRPEDRDHVSRREKRYPIRSWRVGDREDAGQRAMVMYWVRRGGGYSVGEEEVRFWFRTTSGSWIAERYAAIY